MYSQGDLFTEVCAIIDETIARGRPTPPSWIAASIMSRHAGIDGSDSDFYTLCAREHVRRTVANALRRYKPDAAVPVDPNLVLPGFERLQKAYLIERDGEHLAVPLEQLSGPEIDRKIAELQAMGEGCFQHAKELLRYKEQREAA